MHAQAIVIEGAERLNVAELPLIGSGADDLIVDIRHSGISTGTEKLLWSSKMPPFPGMGYPLVPGYEAVGEVVDAGAETSFKPGQTVFVPGASCYKGAKGLFGGASSRLVTKVDRVCRIDTAHGAEGALLALAATAFHALDAEHARPPELIIGHGVLGRMLARLTVALGWPAPTVWEIDEARQAGGDGYQVIHPDDDTRRDYGSVYDVSGAQDILDTIMPRIAKGAEVTLAGFYIDPVSFAFPPAFMKEARFRISAEWTPEDLRLTRNLIEAGRLSLEGLITHQRGFADAAQAYRTAFTDPACLKMILNWEGSA